MIACRSLIVGPGIIRNRIALIETTYRGFELARVDVPRNGYALADLVDHGLVPLRWSTLDQFDRTNPGHGRTVRMIEEAYAGSSAESPATVEGSIERRWVRWRLVFGIVLVVGSPLPYLLGSWLAG